MTVKVGSSNQMAVAVVLLLLGLATELTTAALSRSKRGLLDAIIPSSVCYGDLGCFSTGGNFRNLKVRPILVLPWSPEELNPTFWLFTRSSIINPSTLRYNASASVIGSGFDPQKPTKIICHGWRDTGDSAWMVSMKKALLSYGDFNVIQLDWSRGSKAEYMHSASNTRVVGALVARMVMWLEAEFGANRENFHLIGHSLGSHVCGYAGARLRESDARQLGRITGLDPAGPYFENMHPEVRLDPTDARFVDAIHTDADYHSIVGCGLMQQVGHVDFYPNGGVVQPGCHESPSMKEIAREGILKFSIGLVSCDHGRVRDLFTASLLYPSGDFQAYECASYAEFKAGACLSCCGNRCAQLGIRASEWIPSGRTNISLWSDTQPTMPFYLHHYSVKVKFSNHSFSQESGDLTIALMSTNNQTTSALALLPSKIMEAGQTIQALVASGASVVGVNRVSITWKSSSWNIFRTKKIAIDRVEVFEGYTQQTTSYCGNGVTIVTGGSKTLNLC